MNAALETDPGRDRAYLFAKIAALRAALALPEEKRDVPAALAPSPSDAERPPALERLVQRFELDDLERAVLVLAVGIELDEALRTQSRGALPTIDGLAAVGAVSALSRRARLDVLAPGARLRRHRLVELVRALSFTRSVMHVDERVLHELLGADVGVDERLAPYVTPHDAPQTIYDAAHREGVARVVASLRATTRGAGRACFVVGTDPADRRAVALASARALGLSLFTARSSELPRSAVERATILGLWNREARLRAAMLLVEHDDTEPGDGLLSAWIERSEHPTIVGARARGAGLQRSLPTHELGRPSAAEQRALWLAALEGAEPALRDEVGALVSQFDMGPARIAAVMSALEERRSATTSVDAREALRDACRHQTRPRLDQLAERVETRADWDALVLPPATRDLLRQIVGHARQRSAVLDGWGFGRQTTRGLGLSALFVGPSGTGKTLAAEVIARAIGLDLYRIDLSQVVNKYVGETEKNLAHIFDAADDGSAVLLFDEADALFGKRSETKDSHDRYANIEVGYLLQRMEAHRGLALLTTNFRSAIDKAFLRRFRFLVEFPFPDAALRAEIWRRTFPAETPTQGLDHAALARLHVPGGNIRTIALNAAFLAADEGQPIGMRHVTRAARAELAKLELPVAEVALVEA